MQSKPSNKPRKYNVKREVVTQVFANSIEEARQYVKLNWGVDLKNEITNSHRAS